jgi:hypothetical protein
MKTLPLLFAGLLASAAVPLGAANRVSVTVTHNLPGARPAETIVMPWKELADRLPGIIFDQVIRRLSVSVMLGPAP